MSVDRLERLSTSRRWSPPARSNRPFVSVLPAQDVQIPNCCVRTRAETRAVRPTIRPEQWLGGGDSTCIRRRPRRRGASPDARTSARGEISAPDCYSRRLLKRALAFPAADPTRLIRNQRGEGQADTVPMPKPRTGDVQDVPEDAYVDRRVEERPSGPFACSRCRNSDSWKRSA
jgi:hypothetical protein